jgi:hypothetical protein
VIEVAGIGAADRQAVPTHALDVAATRPAAAAGGRVDDQADGEAEEGGGGRCRVFPGRRRFVSRRRRPRPFASGEEFLKNAQ